MNLAELAKQKIDNYTNNLVTLKDFIRTESTFVVNPTDDNQYLCVEITIPSTCNLTNVDNKLNFIYRTALHLYEDEDFKDYLKKTLRISDIQFLNYNVLTNIDTVEITALIKMPRDNVTKTLKSRFDGIYENVKEEILKNAELGCSAHTIPVEMKMSDLLPLADHEITELENHIIRKRKTKIMKKIIIPVTAIIALLIYPFQSFHIIGSILILAVLICGLYISVKSKPTPATFDINMSLINGINTLYAQTKFSKTCFLLASVFYLIASIVKIKDQESK